LPSLVPGLQTPVAFVAFGPGREPTFSVYGDGIRAGIRAVADDLEDAIAGASALVFGSNTLVGEPERELTLRARDLALSHGIPVVFDPNVRPNRWADMTQAWARCREAVRGSFLTRANLDEARGAAGLDPGAGAEECAEALCGLGARVAVVTMGSAGAVARGEAEGSAAAREVEVVSPLGAGDAFLGALAARAGQGGWTAEAVVAGLADAAAAGARACESWEAVA
jgi:fructokinase